MISISSPDRETDGTSIVYKRKDGKYGLIETTE